MKFLEYFRLLREKYDVSNTELLSELSLSGCNITKGSLSHKLNGERKITREELEVFINVLQPSVAENNKLRQLFKIYDFGDEEFEEVKLIKDYIEQFNNNNIIEFENNEFDLDTIHRVDDEKLLVEVLVNLLFKCWNQKSIEIMCQPDFSKLVDILLNLNNRNSHEVKHLVCFNNDYKTDNNIYNINCLGILDKLVISNANYKIRYFYDKVNARSNAFTVFPFYITAGEKALLLSHDYKTGYLVHDGMFVEKLRQEFDRIFENGFELFNVITNDIEYMNFCGECEKKTNRAFYTLQFHPCIRFNGDTKITRRCVRNDIPYADEIMNFITESWKNPRNIKGYHLHSMKGTQDFLRNGITTDMSPIIFEPVAEIDRFTLLKKVKNNNMQIDIEINDDFIKIPYSLSIVCYDSGIVLISYRGKNGVRLLLKERSLYKSMMNFFSYVCKYEVLDTNGI